MDDRKIEKLIRMLKKGNDKARENAVKALGETGGVRVVEPLIKALEDGLWSVRFSAAWALGRIGDVRAVEPLIKVLGDSDSDDRNSADLRCAVEALGKIGDVRAVEPLIKALGYDYMGDGAVEALGKIGAPAVEPLLRTIENKCGNAGCAVMALGDIGDVRAVEPLIRALGDSDYYVRRAAVKALGKIGDARAVEPLIKVIGDSEYSVREAAAEVLGKIGDARAVEPLIRALGDYYSDVREYAAEALVKIGYPAVEPLISALGGNRWCIREKAAEALGKIGDARAVEPLIRVLGDEKFDVRRGAVEALGKLNWNPKNHTERSYYFIAKRDWASAVSLGVPAIEPLNKIQGYNDTEVQKNIADTLNKIYSQIIEIHFGEFPSNSRTSVKNIDVSQLTIPMNSLTKVLIDADTYDFDMVERFITYSINYVGQKHLRKKVEVHIYGNPEKLHQNLLNSFKNLCRKVIFL